MKPKYPKVIVELSGKNGNAYAIMGRVHRAMLEAKVPQSERELFMKECMSGDYDNLLRTCMAWVTVE